MITEISLSYSDPLIVISQQMAYDFGFEDASNFVKYFKNHTKQTPSQFQKQYIETVL
jgi:AraC family transcriptional regulator, transcriptional activator of pobA